MEGRRWMDGRRVEMKRERGECTVAPGHIGVVSRTLIGGPDLVPISCQTRHESFF